MEVRAYHYDRNTAELKELELVEACETIARRFPKAKYQNKILDMRQGKFDRKIYRMSKDDCIVLQAY